MSMPFDEYIGMITHSKVRCPIAQFINAADDVNVLHIEYQYESIATYRWTDLAIARSSVVDEVDCN